MNATMESEPVRELLQMLTHDVQRQQHTLVALSVDQGNASRLCLKPKHKTGSFPAMMSLKMASPLYLVFLFMISGALGNEWSVKYSQENLCALNGSTVFMNGTYTRPTRLTVKEEFWVIDLVWGEEFTDLRNEPRYSDRVEYLGDEQKHFSFRLSDVKKTDEDMYSFRITTNEEKERWTGLPGVRLTVTDLQVIVPKKVTEGQSAVLTCKTTCSLTDPTFIWYKNSQDLTTKPTRGNEVHLQRVSSEDAGSYSCAVRGYEHLPSPAQTLSVRYPPKNVSVSIRPSGEIVEGSSVTLTCSSDANPPVENYTWFKGTTSVGKGKTYTISTISSEDSGEYKCKCRNEVGYQYSISVTLNVLYPPKIISVSIKFSGEIVEGSSVTLTCSSDANPPVEIYTWFKVNESSAVGSGQSYRALQSGQYYCEAQNKHGSERSAAVSVTLKGNSVIVYVAVGLGFFGLAALLSALFWLRCKRQKKKADEGDDQNAGPSAKDDTYAALNPAGRTSDDVYHTLAISHHSPPADRPTSSDYENISVLLQIPPIALLVLSYLPFELILHSPQLFFVPRSEGPHLLIQQGFQVRSHPCFPAMMSLKMASPLYLVFLFMISGALGNEWSVKYSQENLCALNGSTVFMNGTYTRPTRLTVKEEFWFITEFTDLRNEPGYSDRVEYLGDEQKHFSLRLSDVKKTDEHVYSFRIITNEEKERWMGKPGVRLTVTDLQVNAPEEVTEGQSAVLTCKTTCSLTDPTFIWYKNSLDLTTNTTRGNEVHLQRVSSEDAGSYSCAVRGYEHLPSPAQTLSVRYPPKNVSVSIRPSGEIVEGSSVNLTCSSDANPPVEIYTWFKENKSSPVGSGQSYRALQSGQYYCEAQNKHGSERSAAVSLNVPYPPKNVSVSIRPSGEIVEGSSVTLTCSSDANPPVEIYNWFKGTTPVGKGKTYTISNISSEDSGEYKCKCRNELRHQYSISVTLNVLYPPKNVSVSIKFSGEIVEGSSVNLTCSSDANPPVEIYTWFKVNESSPVGSGQSYRALQSGQYYCEAQNKHGSERSAAVSVTFKGNSVIVYVAVGLGFFGCAALLSALFWLRCKRQKKKADEGDDQNAGPSAKDDTYAALNLAGRTSDDVYHTLAVSVY
ncbi:titin-like [Neoarius graeffei]|uniref:titin-like n=1 Tax=Neoarius graeffei TaxID=443677 RepID=UPI00298C19DB|nr:titin-like [Neoarius graeffei]